jgi:hypothetical protein
MAVNNLIFLGVVHSLCELGKEVEFGKIVYHFKFCIFRCVCEIVKRAYGLCHVRLSDHLSAWNDLGPTG